MGRRVIITVVLIVVLAVILSVGLFVFFQLDEGVDDMFDDFGVRTFFPFGQLNGRDVRDRTNEDIGGDDLQFIPKLRMVSANPVAGVVFVDGGQDKKIRFMESRTGHVFETSTETLTLNRVSNTTIPEVKNALFDETGESVLVQYLEEDGDGLEVFLGKIEKETADTEGGESVSEGKISGEFLSGEVMGVATSPSGESVFYTVESGQGIAGIRKPISGGPGTQVLSSQIREWLVDWSGDRKITMTTKPSFGVLGHVFELDPVSGSFRKIFGGISGITTLTSGGGGSILYSESTDEGFTLNVFDTESGGSSLVQITTLPEKCVWSRKSENLVYCGVPRSVQRGKYPDDWYKGLVSFSDDIWKIDTKNGVSEVVLSPSEFGVEAIDATKLLLNESETHLVFVNKEDSILWAAEIDEGFDE